MSFFVPMRLSLCLTSWNRTDLTMESFSKVYDHDLIDEVVIVDDASDINTYEKLSSLIRSYEVNKANPKIKLFRNEVNLGMSRNKAEAVSKASNEWCILFDSDNILYPEYLNSIPIQLYDDIIYCPIKAEPDYDFSKLPSIITNKSAKSLLHLKEFRILLNTCNYLVNKKEYLNVYEYDESIKESDTIFFNHLWLRSQGSFMLVPGMVYYHRRHEGSGWLLGNQDYNLQKAAEIQEKIKML